MKIGITEQGDSSIDFSWVSKLKTDQVDGALLITKNITQEFIDNVISLHKSKRIIIHCTCTGFGGTYLEPKVPEYTDQLNNLKKLLAAGFPKERCVLRIDPILPTEKGIARACMVMDSALALDLLPDMRVRISIMDEYPHVKRRFAALGLPDIYEGNRTQPDATKIQKVIDFLSDYPKIHFECCAEAKLALMCRAQGIKNLESSGCVDWKDINRMGIEVPDSEADKIGINIQNRKGCLCLSCKTELLNKKKRCPNQCSYCYWSD